MKKFLVSLFFIITARTLLAADAGDEVVVVYNSNLPDSKAVAEYYAARRSIPKSQLFGLALSTNELITRTDFQDTLQKPLARLLEEKRLWHVASEVFSLTNGKPGKVEWSVHESKIRYAVLCYGVPLRIDHDPNVKEAIAETVKPELRRNGAAVDSELALLPLFKQNPPITGPINNPLYTTTNALHLHPTNGLLMVARLDGPSADIAKGLVDKALEAETHGLWGRAYFDWRNLPTNSPYALGDQWIFAAGKICQRLAGFETVFDEEEATFRPEFPMSQIAIYCGWYEETASGPFAQKTVEFMPGAFAYHLHSFSAATIRSKTQRWTGPLLAKGAAVTMGSVDEPYLSGTPDVSVFCARWVLLGFTFGEAAYACQQTLSWQTTVVGDPLYRPFEKSPAAWFTEQQRAHSKSIEWSYLRIVNMNLIQGHPLAEMSAFLQQLEDTKHSSVLTEKLGDLYVEQGKPLSSIEAYEKALLLQCSPLQKVRIRLELADKLIEVERTQDTYDDLKALLAENPDYPGKSTVLNRLLQLANKLGDKNAIATIQHELNP